MLVLSEFRSSWNSYHRSLLENVSLMMLISEVVSVVMMARVAFLSIECVFAVGQGRIPFCFLYLFLILCA